MTTAPPVTTSHRTALAGRITAWGGLLGVAQGLALLLWPPAVTEDRFSYPLTPTGHVVAQVSFAVQHALLLVGVVALLRVAGPASRLVRGGVATAAVGLGLITVLELWVATLADAAATDPGAAVTGVLYSVPTVLIGAGMLAGGIGIVRAGLWTGWRRWTALAVGAYVFVALIPGLSGPFAAGRIALAVWMLLFTALGLTLLRAPR
jgi:hypothetical protein